MVKLLLRSFLFFCSTLPCLLVTSCNRGTHESEALKNLIPTDQMRFQQYMVQGEMLYKRHCANCHQADGSGLKRLIPPLVNADYMLQDVSRTVCIIKYGMEGQVLVNGIDYQQPMPANEALKNIEIAQIATFIYNSWGHQKGYIPIQEIETSLSTCK